MKVDIGDWYTLCCQLDLDRISDEETRKWYQSELDGENEIGVQVWKTEDEVKEFYKYESDYEEILKTLKKLK